VANKTYDTPDFGDFEPFGGFTILDVVFKQIRGNVTVSLISGYKTNVDIVIDEKVDA